MFLSEREFQRWRSFDITPEISKDKTPTFDLLLLLLELYFEALEVGIEDFAESRPLDIVFFTFISQVSRAIYELLFPQIKEIGKKSNVGRKAFLERKWIERVE